MVEPPINNRRRMRGGSAIMRGKGWKVKKPHISVGSKNGKVVFLN